ncbi:MAG: hypothetical protein QSU88_01675, partial [Candidatus Methanoperedens sp.]|nr:hypothetical protein [Candidatus Methanoperedens sp.]
MNQQLAYKLLAAFLVFTMLGSVFAYIFIGARDDTKQKNNTPDADLAKYDPDLWTVNEPFYSISDSLKMTPPGADVAYYVDLESMTLQMTQWTRLENTMTGGLIQEVDTKLYKSNATKLYYADIREGNNKSLLLLSTMMNPNNDFEYIVLPDTNILVRQESDIYNMYNIMGTPTIFAPPQTAVDVLKIIYGQNKTNTSYDQYEGLLSKVEPAPFQIVNSNVTFAKQFYFGVGIVNGSYERTTAYLDA